MTNKNIRFKYFVENLRNVIIPALVVIIFVGILMMVIPSDAIIYTWWQFLINLVVAPSALIGLNMLALDRYIRKTPAKILSDFDI